MYECMKRALLFFLSFNMVTYILQPQLCFLATDNHFYWGTGNRVIKKKQLMGIKNKGFTFLCQKDFTEENTIYVITRNFLLTEDVIIPNDCILLFKGGSIGGKFSLKGQNTKIEAELSKVFTDNIVINGTWNNSCSYSQWFDFSKDGSHDDTQNFQNLINFKGEIYLEPSITICIGSILFPSIYYKGILPHLI